MASGGVSRTSTPLAEPNGINTPAIIPPTTICVFCGSSPGNSPVFMEAATALAKVFHEHNIKLVYGGGTVGLMGQMARTLVELSGPESVHGIIPLPLIKYEQGPSSSSASNHGGEAGTPKESLYGRTIVVRDMHTRKNLMAKEVAAGGPGSGFIALPGGYGTLEELMEVVTWNQLGIHGNGVAVLNIDGYWDGLLKWVRDSVDAGFVQQGNKNIIVEARTGEEAVMALRDYKNSEGRFKLEWSRV